MTKQELSWYLQRRRRQRAENDDFDGPAAPATRGYRFLGQFAGTGLPLITDADLVEEGDLALVNRELYVADAQQSAGTGAIDPPSVYQGRFADAGALPAVDNVLVNPSDFATTATGHLYVVAGTKPTVLEHSLTFLSVATAADLPAVDGVTVFAGDLAFVRDTQKLMLAS